MMKSILFAGLLLISGLMWPSLATAQSTPPTSGIIGLKPLVRTSLTPSTAPGTDASKITAAKLREVFNALIDQLQFLDDNRYSNTIDIATLFLAVDKKLEVVPVADYPAAVAAAVGSRPKLIRVAADVNFDGYARSYMYWPNSVDVDKLEPLF